MLNDIDYNRLLLTNEGAAWDSTQVLEQVVPLDRIFFWYTSQILSLFVGNNIFISAQ